MTTTDEPFIPHADSIQTAWVLMCQQSRISTQPPVEELEAEFDRFLARVKRDAAREALDGVAEHIDARSSWLAGTESHSPKARDVLDYRDRHYPEETPWPSRSTENGYDNRVVVANLPRALLDRLELAVRPGMTQSAEADTVEAAWNAAVAGASILLDVEVVSECPFDEKGRTR